MLMRPEDFFQHILQRQKAALQGSNEPPADMPGHLSFAVFMPILKPGKPLLISNVHLASVKDIDKLDLDQCFASLPGIRWLFDGFWGEDFLEEVNFAGAIKGPVQSLPEASNEFMALTAHSFAEYVNFIRPSMIMLLDTDMHDMFVLSMSNAGYQCKEVRQPVISGTCGTWLSIISNLTMKDKLDTKLVSFPLFNSLITDDCMETLWRTTFQCLDVVAEIPKGAECVMEVFWEGGSESYFRHPHGNFGYAYYKKKVSFDHQAGNVNCISEEHFILDNWESCWHSFTSLAETHDTWLKAYPVYLHPNFVIFIQASLLSEKQRVNVNTCGQKHYLDEWLEKLKIS